MKKFQSTEKSFYQPEPDYTPLRERYLNYMKQLDMEIQRFEEMSNRAKDSYATERDLYAIRLWLRGIFTVPDVGREM